MPKNPTSISGPTIRAFDPCAPSTGHMPHLLTDDERAWARRHGVDC
jgi:hypothetical protein